MTSDEADLVDDVEKAAKFLNLASQRANDHRLQTVIEQLKTDIERRGGGRYAFHGTFGFSGGDVRLA